MNRRFCLAGTVFAALIAAASVPAMTTSAWADGYPTRPIKIIVPWPAGGAADFLARAVGQRLSQRIGAAVIVDDRPGAATNLGTEVASDAAPDGYTLLMASSNNCVNVTLFPTFRVDFRKAFTPITNVADAPNIFVVHPSVNASNVKELIALARSKPGALTYASSGNGSAAHLAAEKFKLQADVDIRGIPYKGAAPAVTDLLAGRTDMMFTVFPAVLPHVQAGELRALAVATSQRVSIIPAIPTMAESGLPGFTSSIWYGLVAPAGTPDSIVKFLNEQIVAVLKEPDTANKLMLEGTFPIGDTPEQFAKTIDDDIGRYRQLITTAGIQVE